MKNRNTAAICVVSCIVGVFIAYPIFSHSAEGWAFEVEGIGIQEKRGEQGYTVCAKINNNSTNESYKCEGCSRGCGTVNVRFDASNPDAGKIRALSTGKKEEICNGESENVCFENDSEPHRWGIIKMKVTLSSPGGGEFDTKTQEITL